VFCTTIRQIKVPEEGCKGETGTVRPATAGLQTNNCFQLLATGGSPGVIQRRGVGRRNGEMHKAAAESGVPGLSFTPFMFFMVRLYLLIFVIFRAFRG